VEQLIAASHFQEHGNDNVSQVINLAALYNDLARPHDAGNALDGVKSGNASPYGAMQIEIEQLSSAEQLGDTAEAKRALEFLQGHLNDSIATYQRALLSATRPEEAAALLKQRLANPDRCCVEKPIPGSLVPRPGSHCRRTVVYCGYGGRTIQLQYARWN
jgi:hypothetical protein